MRRPRAWIILCISLLVAGYVVAGAVIAGKPHHHTPYRQMGVYAEVLEHIQRDYVSPPNLRKVTNGALHGLLNSLDADSSYLSPSEYQQYEAARAQPRQAGTLGLVVSKRGGYAYLVDVEPGSPAARAGLHRGDILETIAGQRARYLSLYEIRHLLSGAPGQAVTLRAVHLRRTQPQSLTLTFIARNPRPILAQRLDGAIAYLRLPDLSPARPAEFAARFRRLRARSVRGLILDLRGCGSGSYAAAAALANDFLRQGIMMRLAGRHFPEQIFRASPAQTLWPKIPMAVLVNAGTSGPAEALAAALLQNHRANLVGDKTFGEGAVQKLFPLPQGGALLLTVAQYEAPDGKPFETTAVTPNIEQVRYPGALPDFDVPPLGVLPPRRDLQLNRALELLHAAPLAKSLSLMAEIKQPDHAGMP